MSKLDDAEMGSPAEEGVSPAERAAGDATAKRDEPRGSESPAPSAGPPPAPPAVPLTPPPDAGQAAAAGAAPAAKVPDQSMKWTKREVVATCVAIVVGVYAAIMTTMQVRQGREALCKAAYEDLQKLDTSYSYGVCHVSEKPGDDPELAGLIANALHNAEGCDATQADPKRIAFYHSVLADLHGEKPGGKAVCESTSLTGGEGVWLRLHCLLREFLASRELTKYGLGMAQLAGDFAKLAEESPEGRRDKLENCTAATKAIAYWALAPVTGQPEAVEHMMAATDEISGPDKLDVAQLVATGLVNYRTTACTPWPGCAAWRGKLAAAERALAELDKMPERHRELWQQILPQVHHRLLFTARGVVLHLGLEANEPEDDLDEGVRELEADLKASKPAETAAVEFLERSRKTMRRDWLRETTNLARADCEPRSEWHRRGATTLEAMRTIYGWWTEARLNPDKLEAVKGMTSWFRWWTSDEEITTALCGLEGGSIDPTEGRRRFERLVSELPQDMTLCALAGSGLWTAGVQRLPWLAELQRKRCPGPSSNNG